jgi:hypothetical protein
MTRSLFWTGRTFRWSASHVFLQHHHFPQHHPFGQLPGRAAHRGLRLALGVPALLAGAPLVLPGLIGTAAAGAGGPVGALPAVPAFEPVTLQRIDLGPGITDASTPVFTLDGGHLLFFAGGHLWLVATTGTAPQCLSCDVAGEPAIAVTEQEGVATEFPDGKRVFFGPPDSRAVLSCVPDLLDCRTKTILPVDFSGGRAPLGITAPGPGQLLPAIDIGGGHAAKLAPDGIHIGFSDEASNSVEEMIIATLVRGSTSYTLTDAHVINPQTSAGPADNDPVHWSDGEALFELKTFARGGADATYVSVGAPAAGNPDVIEVDLATGKTTRLTSGPDWDEDDAPSPDGSSIVVESDRTMHRTDLTGLLPVRGFADAAATAAAAAYFVGDNVRRQCDLQPWLLPASGDDGAALLGQPLQPYTGGDIHAANNVSGYPQWSPDGTEIALNTESYTTAASAPYLVVAHLTARAPTAPLPVVSSEPGSWAPSPEAFHGSLQGSALKVLHGQASGTATILHLAPLGIAASYDRVVYRGYSDDGLSFTSGTVSVANQNIETGPVTVDADLTITGAHHGWKKAHISYHVGPEGWTVSGSGTATMDGTTVTGPPQVPEPCPESLPRKQPLELTAERSGGVIRVHVQSTIHGAGPAENLDDTRPVRAATVSLDGAQALTDSTGDATLAVPAAAGPWTVSVTAGDTMVPASIVLSGR